eukprot:1103719-Prymnesium_polylepis.1
MTTSFPTRHSRQPARFNRSRMQLLRKQPTRSSATSFRRADRSATITVATDEQTLTRLAIVGIKHPGIPTERIDR